MTALTSTANLSSKGSGALRYQEIAALHRRCGIYTKPELVRRILDAIGWRTDVDLTKSVLLEPAAGDGAFVLEAARRLIGSYMLHGIETKARSLCDRIQGFEIHPVESRKARLRITKMLGESGLEPMTANACAKSWIRNSDFLCAQLPPNVFTHAAGNPPYVRWSKIPPNLKTKYEQQLGRDMVGGDLFVPFLDRSLDLLSQDGHCGFVCSNRWRFMAFAESFRRKWLPLLDILSDDEIESNSAFAKRVDSYPSVFVARKTMLHENKSCDSPIRFGKTLGELGCTIRVGPALGHAGAFLLGADEHDVEPQLLNLWIDGSEISEGFVVPRGRRVVLMHDEAGQLVDLNQFPLLRARLDRHRRSLEDRSRVQRGAPWFQTIDRVRAADWHRPKILVPELAKVPRCAIDRSGAVPSHGVYAIFAPNDDVEHLYEKLKNGKLAKALEGTAPRVKGGYVRCYKRFLSMICLD